MKESDGIVFRLRPTSVMPLELNALLNFAE